jgi:hypothetical protein
VRGAARRRIGIAVGIGWVLAWLVTAEVVVPALGRLPPSHPLWRTAAAEGLRVNADGFRPSAALAPARRYARWVALGGVGFAALAWLLTCRRMARALVPRVSAATLGVARAWAFGLAAAITLFERAPTTAALPRGMLRSMGLFDVFRLLPGAESLLESQGALQLLEFGGLAVLALATLGLWSRWTTVVAAGFFLFEQGLLRAYSRFFHTGLVLCYVLLVLAMAPCGDGFSLDRRRARRASPPAAARYGWALWCCWLVVALPYLEAGLMKLRRGGWAWFQADNLRAIVLTDSLGLLARARVPPRWILGMPDGLVSAMAIAAVALEVLFPLVLVSRSGRFALPLLMAGFHVSTWLLQGVFFLDLFLLQALFLLPSAGGPGEPVPVGAPATGRGAPRAKADTSGSVRYLTLVGRHPSGIAEPVALEACVPALRDGRYRWVLDDLFVEGKAAPGTQLIETCLDRLPIETGAEPLESMLVERWRWDFSRKGATPVRVDCREIRRGAGVAPQTAKLDPQPQLPTAFGFENLNPAPCMPRT